MNPISSTSGSLTPLSPPAAPSPTPEALPVLNPMHLIPNYPREIDTATQILSMLNDHRNICEGELREINRLLETVSDEISIEKLQEENIYLKRKTEVLEFIHSMNKEIENQLRYINDNLLKEATFSINFMDLVNRNCAILREQNASLSQQNRDLSDRISILTEGSAIPQPPSFDPPPSL